MKIEDEMNLISVMNRTSLDEEDFIDIQDLYPAEKDLSVLDDFTSNFTSKRRRKGLKIEDEINLIRLSDKQRDIEDFIDIKDLFPEYPEDTHKAVLLKDKAFTINGRVITFRE